MQLHSLYGGNISVSYPDTPPCNECVDSNRHIIMSFEDPARPGISGEIIFTHFLNNLEEKMRLRLRVKLDENYFDNPNYNGPSEFSMSQGDYTFVKQ